MHDLLPHRRCGRGNLSTTSCDPDPDPDSYWFHVYRCCTERDLLGGTAHLLEKEWLKYTDWGKFIDRVLRANGWEDTP